jgi:carboxymethylenebutenolidase
LLSLDAGGQLAFLYARERAIDVLVVYDDLEIAGHLVDIGLVACPLLMHFGLAGGQISEGTIDRIRAALAGREDIAIELYPDADRVLPASVGERSNRLAAKSAHSRTIALLRRVLGPQYDLGALWEKHCEFEFDRRDADGTMTTMVPEPYVNHIPTMTGGVGYAELHRFYKNHFVSKLPRDARLVPVSRTIGADRVVDEFLFCCTHDVEIDFFLPGVPPTGKYVEIPTVAIVCFRGGKLYNEHIYWDQASVLVQVGLLDPKDLPIAGRETAAKLLDETQPSNTLMARWAESAPAE